jgi:hypothetical protein
MSFAKGFGSESRIIGRPMTAASTNATAPMSRRRARFFSGSIGSTDSLSLLFLRRLRPRIALDSSSDRE